MNVRVWLYRLSKPPGIMCRQYLSLFPSAIIKQHRQIFFYLNPRGSYFKELFKFIARIALWYLYFGWKELYDLYKFTGKKFSAYHRLSGLHMCYDLFYATFIYCIPPYNYFLFELYSVPKNKWSEFFYSHEVPVFQYILNGEVSDHSMKYLTSKHYFSRQAILNGILAIETIGHYKKHTKLSTEDLFRKKSLYLKPDNMHGGAGCIELRYNDDSYLVKVGEDIVESENNILATINIYLDRFDYIIQPLLTNHSELTKIFNTDKLSVIRIVSNYANGTIFKIISSIIFVTQPDDSIVGFRINPESGLISKEILGNRLLIEPEKSELNMEKIHKIPFWQEVRSNLKKAHSRCPDIKMVGWDVVISTSGIKILEGNIGNSIELEQVDMSIEENPISSIFN